MEFDDYLAALKDASQPPKVGDLAKLSALSAEEAVAVERAWPEMEPARRRWIVQELIDLEEDNVEFSFDDVFKTALRDEDANTRALSIQGLWEYEKPDLIAALASMVLEDESRRVRAEAALGLGRYVRAFQEGHLSEHYFREVERALRQTLERKEEIEEVLGRALEAIGPYGGAWVRQAIREAYESDVRRLKVSAVHAMGRSCEERWLPLVARELSSEEAEVRYEAAVACGSIGDEKAVPGLARLLSDSDDEVRQATIAALGEIGGREARTTLTEHADGGTSPDREAALAALAEIDFADDPLSFRYRA